LEALKGKFLQYWHALKEKCLASSYLIEDSHNHYAGLDLGNHFVRLLKINTLKSPYLVEHYAETDIPKDAIVDGKIIQAATVIEKLKEIKQQSGITSNEVAIAIPRSLTVVKTITVNNRLDPNEIESRVWIEAKRHFPDLVGNICLDFVVTDNLSEDASRREIILVACRKDVVMPLPEIFQEAGLTVKIVDVNSYAIQRALFCVEALQNLSTRALLNLNFDSSSFIINLNGKPLYANDQTFNGKHFIDQAQDYLKSHPLDDQSALLDAGYLELLRASLMSHLRHVMHTFYSAYSDVTLQKMALAGDCVVIPGLAEFIKQETGIEAVIANPFRQMTFAPGVASDTIIKQAPELMLCCGLALNKPGE